MAKVSVIVPCYNQGHFIMDALNSVAYQTYNNWEIVIVNDGSTDAETNSLLAKLKFKNTKVLSTQNFGLAQARNIGIAASDGELIIALDADDMIGETYLERAVKYFQENANIKIVYSRAAYFGKESGEWELPEFSMKGMLKQNLIFCSAIFKRMDFEPTHGYNPNMKFGWEDWDLWLTLLSKGGDVYKIPEILFFYRKHDLSMVEDIQKVVGRRQFLEQQLIRNHTALYLKYFPEPLTLLRTLDFYVKENEDFEKHKTAIYQSLSYKIGNFLLCPLKKLRGKFFS